MKIRRAHFGSRVHEVFVRELEENVEWNGKYKTQYYLQFKPLRIHYHP
jgi:hypothetical protein